MYCLTVSNPFGEVPVLPVVVPLAVVVCIVLIWRLRARRLLSVPSAAVAAMIAVYAAGVVGNTVFPIFLNAPDSGSPWSPAMALIPFHDYEVADALMNMAVFVPLGVLIPLLLARPSWRRVLATVAGTSIAIELTQLVAQRFFAGGHIADINDFIFNVVGGALGFALFLLVNRVPVLRRVIDRFRWVEIPVTATERKLPAHASRPSDLT